MHEFLFHQFGKNLKKVKEYRLEKDSLYGELNKKEEDWKKDKFLPKIFYRSNNWLRNHLPVWWIILQ